MAIDRIGVSNQQLISNAQHVGRQTEGVRRADTKPAGGNEESHAHQTDSVDISESTRRGREAGETTGMAGRQGARETRTSEHAEQAQVGGDVRGREDAEPKPAQTNAQATPEEPVMPPTQGGIAEQPMYIMGGPGAPGGDASQTAAPGAAAQGAPGGAQQTPPPGQEAPSMTDIAMKQKEAQEDMQKAQAIYAEMAASRQKWLAQMWQIIQDTQTAILTMMQDAAVRRAKMMDAAAAKWAACLGGY
ncbi:MAG: hypothetical protein LWY06_19125 [Firmicutes bacterium]|nr:hypothetical protein [Bacillota bacterium]